MFRNLSRQFEFRHRPERDNLPIAAVPRTSRRKAAGMMAMARVMRDMGFKEGVEVGTNKGASAEIWCSQNPALHLTCIDPYAAYRVRPRQGEQDAVYKLAKERLKDFNVTLRREYSLDAVKTFEDGSLDFVLIDGDHRFDEAMQDIICWVPKVRKGGFVLIHDYTVMDQGGVMAAVDAYVLAHVIDPWYVTREFTPMAFWQKGAERV